MYVSSIVERNRRVHDNNILSNPWSSRPLLFCFWICTAYCKWIVGFQVFCRKQMAKPLTYDKMWEVHSLFPLMFCSSWGDVKFFNYTEKSSRPFVRSPMKQIVATWETGRGKISKGIKRLQMRQENSQNLMDLKITAGSWAWTSACCLLGGSHTALLRALDRDWKMHYGCYAIACLSVKRVLEY